MNDNYDVDVNSNSNSKSMWRSVLQSLFPGPVKIDKYEIIDGIDDIDIDPISDKNDNTNDNDDNNDIDNPYDSIDVKFNSSKKVSSLVKVPYYLDIYNISNMGLIVSYFAIGIVTRLIITPVDYYLIDHLDCSAADYSVYKTLHKLPWSLKVVCGIISDSIPIAGYRRKPWLIIGWIGFVIFNLLLVKIGDPSITQTIVLVFLLTCFLVLADVCTDTLCVERAAFEPEAVRGNLQNVGFIYRSLGKIIGAVMGAFLYDNGTRYSMDIGQIFLLDAVVPIVSMTFCSWPLLELVGTHLVPTFSEQMKEVWRLLQLKAVWYPMIFIYTYGILQVPNQAWKNYLVYGLGFNDAQLGYVTIMSAVLGCFGYVLYKFYLFQTSWRKIYLWTGVVSTIFSFIQILLILKVNRKLGIPDVVFAVGDDAIVSLMEGLHSMPTVTMYVMLCGGEDLSGYGSEGTTFALLTTIGSLAGTVANDIGTVLTGIWDVSNDTLAAGNYSGILKLTILCSFLQLLPLLLINMLPNNRDDHKKHIEARESNFWGGFWLAATVVSSLLLTVLMNLVLLMY